MTDQQIATCEKYKSYWISLRDAGFMANLPTGAIGEIQKVYHETQGSYTFTAWCPVCVMELMKAVYTYYEKFLNQTQA